MKLPRRFALRTLLLLLMLVVSLVFGYAQLRRQKSPPQAIGIAEEQSSVPVVTNYTIRGVYETYPATLSTFISMLKLDSEVHTIEDDGTFHPPVNEYRRVEYLRLLCVAGLQGTTLYIDRRDGEMTANFFKSGWKNMRLVYTTEGQPKPLDFLFEDDPPPQIFEPIKKGWFVGINDHERLGSDY